MDAALGAGSFGRLTKDIKRLADCGINFGLTYGMNNQNFADVRDVANFAIAMRASRLHVWPQDLATTGRGKTASASLSEEQATWAIWELQRVKAELGGVLKVEFDFLPQLQVACTPSLHFNRSGIRCGRLADLISPLVIEADGAVSPLLTGLQREYRLGNLHNKRLDSIARAALANQAAPLRRLTERVQAAMRQHPEHPYLRWQELMRSASYCLAAH